ncbi:MAG TPA: hypothetical protein VFV99_33575, partial [Kofleriaceae bacterium]|nr:hypothetical protein [Kofleriaceae bacterium]
MRDLVITARPDGSWFTWVVEVVNKSRDSVSVDWDQSSLVAGNGDSMGRLLRGETRRIDSANVQPKTPIPPGARVSQWVIPEQMTMMSGASEGPLSPMPPLAYPGARLVISVERKGKTASWTGVLTAT